MNRHRYIIPDHQRGHRPTLKPGEKTVQKMLAMAESTFQKVQEIAENASRMAGKTITWQAVVRHMIESRDPEAIEAKAMAEEKIRELRQVIEKLMGSNPSASP